MNSKKGLVHEFLKDMAVVFPILIMMIVFWFIVMQTMRDSMALNIKEKEVILKDTETLLNILRNPVGQDNIADLIVMRYEGKDAAGLEGKISEAVNLLYRKQTDPCWRLYAYPEGDRQLIAYKECSSLEKEPLLDAKTYLPLIQDKGSIQIRLVVPGYS